MNEKQLAALIRKNAAKAAEAASDSAWRARSNSASTSAAGSECPSLSRWR